MQYETGVVYSLKELGERFIKFARTSNSSVQAWELVDDRIDTFYGATLKVPLLDSDDISSTENYYIIGDESLVKYPGTSDVDIPTYLRTKYPNDDIIVDTTKTTLNSVLDYAYSLSMFTHKRGIFIFNGVENAIVEGKSIQQIIILIEAIFKRCDELHLSCVLCITPNSFVYSSSSYLDTYNAFLNNGYVGDKKSIVCIGDSFTASDVYYSWVPYAQERMSDYYFINKATSSCTIDEVFNNFQQYVLDLSPDVCFFFIGSNDLINTSLAGIDALVNKLDVMFTYCLDNDILPVMGLYRPTLSQIRNSLSSSSIHTQYSLLEVFNVYMAKCKKLAEGKGLHTVDVFYSLRGGYGNIDPINLSYDGVHFSATGAEVVGKYVAKSLKDIFLYGILDKVSDPAILNIYDIFCSSLGVSHLDTTDINSLLSLNGKSYNTQGLYYIIQSFENIKYLNHNSGVGFYISFQFNKINQQTTYLDFIKGKDKYMSESGQVLLGDVVGKYGNSPFKFGGQILAVGLHTLFDKDLWMCEQGGITCAKEALYQQDTDNLMQVRLLDRENVTETLISFIPFPSRGCPWFAFSDDDEEKYKIDVIGIRYWFTKNNYDATIVYCTSEQIGEPVFQSMSFGRLNAVNEMSYKFPLYIAGGTEALRQDVYVYTPISGGLPRPIYGNVYDLSLKNVGLSSCGILRPCKFNGATSSNFRVLAPEGVWRNIFGCSQSSKGQQYFSCGVIYNWMTILQAPDYSIGATQHSALPFMSDSHDAVDFRVPVTFEESNSVSFLGRVLVSFNMSIDHNENGVQGYIPNLYYICRRDTPVGEITIDGKRFLSVPNNYESKKEYYPVTVGLAVNTGWTSEEILAREEEAKIKTTIYDRILIPIE